MHVYDTIIIGGGPAGYTAALYAARAGLDTAILERMSVGGQMALTGSIDNYPGFEQGIDGFTLGMKMQQGAERFGAVTLYGEAVSLSLRTPVKEIVTADTTYCASTVIIATGADPATLGLENEDQLTGRGVHYCAHCDGRFYKDKVVVVVGGGNTAAADALYLSNLAAKVYLVHRRDTLRADKVYHDPLFAAANVEFCWNSQPEAIVCENGKVTGLRVKSTTGETSRVLKCDGIFVSIGRRPATEFLQGALDTSRGYIIADESTRSSVPGVFAAGDVRTKELRQVVTAVADGACAAHAAQEYLALLQQSN
jgi:thioredoxin reductase (NADPH)